MFLINDIMIIAPLLNVKEHHEHSAKCLILCFTEEDSHMDLDWLEWGVFL